jgi:hypothetical protein
VLDRQITKANGTPMYFPIFATDNDAGEKILVTDILGKSGRAMRDALCEGTTDPKILREMGPRPIIGARSVLRDSQMLLLWGGKHGVAGVKCLHARFVVAVERRDGAVRTQAEIVALRVGEPGAHMV